MSKELSSWIVIDNYCATRVIEGSDPEKIKNRVAFIEKTPKVRTAPYIEKTVDYKVWKEGPKGDGGDSTEDKTYGFSSKSRHWCDMQLKEMGYTFSKREDHVWLSTDEELPLYEAYAGGDQFVHTIICIQGKKVTTGMFCNGYFEINGVRINSEKISHWMPFPGAPGTLISKNIKWFLMSETMPVSKPKKNYCKPGHSIVCITTDIAKESLVSDGIYCDGQWTFNGVPINIEIVPYWMPLPFPSRM